MFIIYFSWWRNQVENFRVPTTSAKVKVATAGRVLWVWNNKDSAFQLKLPSGIGTADVTFMGTSGVHKFDFTSDSAKASHVAWEHLDYDHTANAFLLDCAFIHCSKHPQVVELPLPRVMGFTEYYNCTRPSHLVDGALVRCRRSYSPTEIRSMWTIGLEQSPAYFSRRASSASRMPSRVSSCHRHQILCLQPACGVFLWFLVSAAVTTNYSGFSQYPDL